MTNGIDFSIDRSGVANLIFDLPDEKINKLSKNVLEELERAINVIDGNKAIRVLLISSHKKDIFIAGADINEIRSIVDEKDAHQKVSRGQEILNKLAKIEIPTIAVIKGACLGGGLELALACQYRVAVLNSKTQLGLPEVNLGIIPGFGGTQRLPALVGLEESLKIILSGKAIDGEKAYKIGLVDEAIHEEFLEESLSSFVTEIIKNGKKNKFLLKRNSNSRKRFYTESLLMKKHLIFYFAQKDLWEKTKGHYLAQFFALEVVKKTYRKTYGNRGFKIELDAFCDLAVGDISKNLIEIYFTSEALKKDAGVDDFIAHKDIKNVALLGAGIMGGGIAWLFANYNFNVRIKDITQQAIALGYNQILKIFNQLQKIRKLNSNQVSLKMANVSAGLDYTNFDHSDLVIEAVVENIAVKKNILKEIEAQVPNDAIIASNTSSLSISEMAQALENPSRFVGMHFFNPVNKMPLVEVIYGEKTSNETVASIVKISKKLGKTPIVVKDVPGFLVNRILLTYLNESAYLLQDGFSIKKIDSEIERFGMPMGPFVLADVVGIDVGVKVAQSLENGYGSRMKVAEILQEIYANHKNLLGKKSNLGFYNYDKNNKITDQNFAIYEILDSIKDQIKTPESNINDSEIIERCILTMINESAKCLEENVVKNARYLDMAMIMGAGFPAFRGGVLRYADKLGLQNIVKKLQNFEKKYGERFAVSKLLISMEQNNQKFYD
jgi:3-hydroxyacyl-CoA dehydrogenase / enoyl-CoA hydratase / 3-hydroxybutyryl-CoA epimerase